jgi:hypothetical protein
LISERAEDKTLRKSLRRKGFDPKQTDRSSNFYTRVEESENLIETDPTGLVENDDEFSPVVMHASSYSSDSDRIRRPLKEMIPTEEQAHQKGDSSPEANGEDPGPYWLRVPYAQIRTN